MKANMLRLLGSRSAAALLLGALAGCPNHPVQDDFRREGGSAPDPSGVIEGSIVYIGPRPTCVYDEAGNAERVIGRVILTLFRYDNPPPPEGRATTAENLFALSGDELFSLTDCLPAGATPTAGDVIMRSVAFKWPQIVLAVDTPTDFQMRGFYDYDEDMNPFFRVKNLPTAGDIAGAAVVSLQDRSKGFLRIQMPAQESARDGFVFRGVTVALGNPVWTERPVFKLTPEYRALDAELKLPLATTGLSPDVPATIKQTWELTCGAPDCGLAIEQLDEAIDGPKLAAAGVALDFNPTRYAFFTQPIDIKTVVVGGPDLNQPDGIPDPHPVLGSTLAVPYMMPTLILQRRALDTAQATVETQARIPGVTFVGALLPDEIETQRTFLGKINVAVPPVAVVDLDPVDVTCRIPYLPPGQNPSTYESKLTYCSDLPTGRYGANVLHGIAGGSLQAEPDPTISPNGVVVTGGGLSGQAWSLPNELAEPVQVDDVLPHQGIDGLFIVHDPNPDQTGDCVRAPQPLGGTKVVEYRGICGPEESPLLESEGDFGTLPGIDGSACLPQHCCDGVAHLCGIPLCDVVEIEGRLVRGGPTSIVRQIEGGPGVPNCVPFAIPALCCPAE